MKNFFLSLLLLFLNFPSFATVTPVLGPASVCIGSMITLNDSTAGGVWSSSNAAVASVGTDGIVMGVAAGAVAITYAVGTNYATMSITVSPAPAPITGMTTSLCNGAQIEVFNATPGGGIWGCGPALIILSSDSSSALVAGYGGGADNVQFTDTSGCSVYSASVWVYPAPYPVMGTTTTNVGSTTALSATPGGTWGSYETSIATVGAATGIVTGVSVGSATIYCETSCGTTSATVTVLPQLDVPFHNAIGKSKIDLYPNPATTSFTVSHLK